MKSNEWHDTRTSFFEWHDTNDQKVKKNHHLILKKPTKNILQKKMLFFRCLLALYENDGLYLYSRRRKDQLMINNSN